MKSPQPPSPPLPKTQPRSQASLLPFPIEGEPGNEVAKNTAFENKTIQPKNPVTVSNATKISSEKISRLERPLEDVCICGNIRGGRRNLSLAWWHFLDSKPEFFIESNEPLVYMVNTEKINYISCPYYIMTWSICYEEPADEKACRLPIWLNPDWMWATWISTLFWKQLKEKIYKPHISK